MKKLKDYRKILIKLGKELVESGLTSGSGGNISLKAGGYMYIKASGTWFKEARKNDFVKVSLGTYKKTFKQTLNLKPSCEHRMHLACYNVREDINCVIHSHPIYAITFASKFKRLRPVTCEFAAILKTDVPVLKYLNPGSKELSYALAKNIFKYNGVILSHHGVVTVGRTAKEAYYRALLIEQEAKIVLLSSLFGKVKYLSKKVQETIVKSEHSEYRRQRLQY